MRGSEYLNLSPITCGLRNSSLAKIEVIKVVTSVGMLVP